MNQLNRRTFWMLWGVALLVSAGCSDSADEDKPPAIVETHQDATAVQPGAVVRFEVTARDPEGGTLRFAWTPRSGTLGRPEDTATTSAVLWTAPDCLPRSVGGIPSPEVATVTVRDGAGQEASAAFQVEGLPPCPMWIPGGELAMVRFGHTATLLSSGKVLVAAGVTLVGDKVVRIRTAEVYEPATKVWTPTGGLATARDNHTATLLPSGKVLVAGGTTEDGEGRPVESGTAELYDPATGTWTATGGMRAVRGAHTATLLPSGKVLVVAKSIADLGEPVEAELYDPETGTWTTTRDMERGPAYSATLLPSGKVLVTGNQRAFLYDPAAGTWTATGDMTVFHSLDSTATLLPSGKVLVAGGDNDVTPAELYDPATGTWTATGSMARARSDHTATLLPSGKVLLVGGNLEDTLTTSAELYDPATHTWTATDSTDDPRGGHTTTLLPSGNVLLVSHDSSELYLP